MNRGDVPAIDVMATIWCDALGEMDINPVDFDRIDAEWSRYVDGGKTTDKLIHCESWAGTEIIFTISRLQSMLRNTREQRATQRLHMRS